MIRKAFEKAGYSVGVLSDEDLGEHFNLKMVTGGSVEYPQRGWTVMPAGSALSETIDLSLGALSAVSVVSAFRSGGKNPSALLARGGGGSKVIQNMLRALSIKARTKELKQFDDVAGGKLDELEAEGLAIFEESLGKGKRLSPSNHAGADAMLGNEYISHLGTGGRRLDDAGFDKWLNGENGAFRRHYRSQGVDKYVIDVRSLTSTQKQKVREAVTNMGQETATKTYLIE